MAPPTGLTIGSTTKPYTIGRILGSGACGSVHELIAPAGSKHTDYAIKLAPLPKSKPANGKKRKKTEEEKNADLISYEHLTLRNLGVEVRGRLVPDIPFVGPPAYGEIEGYRFLVMDRMEAPLAHIISILHDSHVKSPVSKVPLGDVAVSMLNCLHAMHSTGLVYVDVKTDNFMLAPANKSKKGSLCDRIRLIDFGLVESIHDMTTARHREDVEGSALVGTPNYASLNVMEGHTASRRDDLEALGYVLCELIFSLGQGKREGCDNVLPWSGAKSDAELLNMKKLEMDVSKRSKSKLFTALKEFGADAVMNNYFKEVQGLKYASAPDYESLRCYLKKLIVTVQSSGKKKAGKSTSPVRKSSVRRSSKQVNREESDSDDDVVVKSPLRRTTRNAKREESDDDVVVVDSDMDKKPAAKSPKKQRVAAEKASSRRSTRITTKTFREIATQTDPADVMDVEESEDDAEIRNMEWEKIDDENEPPKAKTARGRALLKLEIIEGPHAGQTFSMGGHHNDTMIVGKDPKANSKPSTKDAFAVSLPEDEYVSSLHAKFVLTSNKNIHSLKVTDMSSSNGTIVGGSALAKGKSKQAFPGTTIQVGDSVFKISKC
ncbi:hypothetical protein ACHAXN_004097 [Cyclotella atomus]